MAYATIDKPSKYFNTLTYTGNASYPRSITGVGFKPDFTWIKTRSSASFGHSLTDAVRGANNILLSESTGAEFTNANNVNAFASDGFTLGNTNYSGYSNSNAENYVAWNWLGANTTVSNTSGTITSTVSANTTSGFSIVSYTGTGANATVGHGLGVAPKMIIIKGRDTTYDWIVWFSGFSTTQRLILNDTSATSTGQWNTLPTSSVFGLGTHLNINQSGSALIAYCFADVKGFSKFGSYTGNNANDGTFVYTGFKPAFILVKTTNTTQWWTLLDNKRDTYNVATLGISPNSSNSESTFNTDRGNPNMDFVSNGFKIRTDNSGINGTNSFIYMAFAENPFVSSKGIACTAR